ncbi:MAG: hypothetical protein LUD72_06595 [Bacteroidales bacterium]|nr:hypothetical protein [Bacteroidales bacterium]
MDQRRIRRQQARDLLDDIDNARKRNDRKEWEKISLNIGEEEADILSSALTLYINLLSR